MTLLELLESAPGAYRSLRLAVRTWIDHDAFLACSRRFIQNRMVAEFVERAEREGLRGQEEEVRKIWLLPPRHAREEVYAGASGTLVEAHGHLGDREWDWGAGEPPQLGIRPASPSVAALVPRAQRSAGICRCSRAADLSCRIPHRLTHGATMRLAVAIGK